MPVFSIENYSPNQVRAAKRVLETLDRVEDRLSDRYSEQRQHQRKTFRTLVTVALPDPDAGYQPRESWEKIQVWGRCISQGGMSFIYPEEITSKEILVALPLANGAVCWFAASIVRARELVSDDFWEYGVAFRERVQM